jgi:hypothetical protein
MVFICTQLYILQFKRWHCVHLKSSNSKGDEAIKPSFMATGVKRKIYEKDNRQPPYFVENLITSD